MNWGWLNTNIGRIWLRLTQKGFAACHLSDDTSGHSCGELSTLTGPYWLHDALVAIIAHTEGTRATLDDLPLDYTATPFEMSVYQSTQKVPWGEAISYGAIAKRIGKPKAARAVGRALGRNPIPLLVPCHRVVASSGRLTGFSSPGGCVEKARLLRLEGLTVSSEGTVSPVTLW